MLIAIAGTQGSGKTLLMSILSTFLAQQTNSPLTSNYSLKGSKKILKQSDLWDTNNSIMCLDELWLTMDSRLSRDNVFLTRFINQTRKKGLVVFYTTQHMSQVDLRIRNATDYLIFCENKNGEIVVKFIDYQYGIIHKQFVISDPKKFYPLYDTYQVLQPLLP